MAEPGDDAAKFIDEAPFEVMQAILGRLSPKSILRMRAVCKLWDKKLCLKALVTGLNREEPPQPLLCFDRAASPADRYSDYCIESLDLRSEELRAVFRFTDNEDDLEGGHGDGDAPPIDDVVVDFERMKKYAKHGEATVKYQGTVHASLDGYLLVSFSSSLGGSYWYIINPATRQWVSVFDLTSFGLSVVGFYENGTSSKYQVLCMSRSNVNTPEQATTYSYHIIGVRPGERRHIGCPLSSPAATDYGLRFRVERASVSPPIQWKRGNMDLLWPPQKSQGYRMLVFDTRSEVFSWKRPPRVAIGDGQHMSLLELPDDGDIGLSISRENGATLDLWRLRDYRNEIWVLKYRIQLALHQMPDLLRLRQEGRPWVPAVVSAEGDVLIESQDGLFHYDRDGNFLRRFEFNHQAQSSHRVFPVRHVLRRGFGQHPMFRPSGNADEPPFFHWLFSADE